MCSCYGVLIFEHLLNVARFALNFARDLFTLATAFHIGVVGRNAETFLHAAFHFAHLTFCLIVGAVFHNFNLGPFRTDSTEARAEARLQDYTTRDVRKRAGMYSGLEHS